jgi:hypothetical protein
MHRRRGSRSRDREGQHGEQTVHTSIIVAA